MPRMCYEVARRQGVKLSKLIRKGVQKMRARRLFKSAYTVFARYEPGDVQSLLLEVRLSRQLFAEDIRRPSLPTYFFVYSNLDLVLAVIACCDLDTVWCALDEPAQDGIRIIPQRVPSTHDLTELGLARVWLKCFRLRYMYS